MPLQQPADSPHADAVTVGQQVTGRASLEVFDDGLDDHLTKPFGHVVLAVGRSKGADTGRLVRLGALHSSVKLAGGFGKIV